MHKCNSAQQEQMNREVPSDSTTHYGGTNVQMPIAPQFWGSHFVLDERLDSEPDSDSDQEGWGHDGEHMKRWREEKMLGGRFAPDNIGQAERPSRAYIHLITLGELFGGDLMSCVVTNPSYFSDPRQLVLREISRQCFFLLSELHKKKLMHRDIKLSNILIKWIPWSHQPKGKTTGTTVLDSESSGKNKIAFFVLCSLFPHSLLCI